MNKKKTLASVLAILMAISGFSGCFGGSNTTSSESFSESATDSSSVEEVDEGLLYENLSNKIDALKTGEEIVINIDKEVENNNFLTIQLRTDCNLLGYIHYTKSGDASTMHKEKIYVEADAEEFSIFLDAFRIGAFGAYEKRIEKITLRNVDAGTGYARVHRVEIGDRTYNNQEMLYTANEHLKIGASLAAGGSLCHVESLDRKVVEYIDENGFTRIDENVNKEDVTVITDQVNLVNVHDLGREIQQSFYSNIDETNGYAPDDDVLYEGNLLYNPVQAGSAGHNQSQIIDYHVTDSEIYVKCRPQDWFLRNTQTDSYMESTYAFAEDGTLRVTNRFVNFSEYKDMDKARIGGQETPAIYIVHPLNYFYCETRSGTINDPNLLDAMTTQQKLYYDHEVKGDYHYVLNKDQFFYDWFAFVNDKKFGLGIYMPKFDQLVASRGWTSTNYEYIYNSDYNYTIYQLNSRRTPSMYVSNYNYCCPSVLRRMVDFVPFEYTFALYVGTVYEMKAKFERMDKKNEIPNSGIEAWETIDW